MKKYIKVILIIITVSMILYIGVVLILENKSNKQFCEIMCKYDPDKSSWYLPQVGLDRFFPTKKDCLDFCKIYKKDFGL